MIHFFRRIRQGLLSQNRFSKYMLYAIGEILLVVIGILIALQINNWNEGQKNNKEGIEIYKNLQRSLKQDSIAVSGILITQRNSLDAQKSIFLNDINEFKAKTTYKSLDSLLYDIMFGTFSFYPKNGIYNLIVANNSLDLLASNKIKSDLNNLYEYLYKRYESLDPIVEHKFQFQMNPLVSKKMGLVIEFGVEVKIVGSVNSESFESYYDELSAECKDIFTVLSASNDLLKNIERAINDLLALIRTELENY